MKTLNRFQLHLIFLAPSPRVLGSFTFFLASSFSLPIPRFSVFPSLSHSSLLPCLCCVFWFGCSKSPSFFSTLSRSLKDDLSFSFSHSTLSLSLVFPRRRLGSKIRLLFLFFFPSSSSLSISSSARLPHSRVFKRTPARPLPAARALAVTGHYPSLLSFFFEQNTPLAAFF